MRYSNIQQGIFIDRPNRFIANVIIDDTKQVCHVKNTGRCKELLVPGATVFLEKTKNPARKTKWNVIAVKKQDMLINMDSVAPNLVAAEMFAKCLPGAKIHREVTYKGSRFDLFIEDTNTFVEVKGVTLENDRVAMFPDAPTVRGRKHIYELIDAKNNGYGAMLLFVIQFSGAKSFVPNTETDKAFHQALIAARDNGVDIMAVDCFVTPDTLNAKSRVEICLDM